MYPCGMSCEWTCSGMPPYAIPLFIIRFSLCMSLCFACFVITYLHLFAPHISVHSVSSLLVLQSYSYLLYNFLTFGRSKSRLKIYGLFLELYMIFHLPLSMFVARFSFA